MSRRRRWARSSGGAAGSIILSIAFAASSFARLARAADGCLAFVLTVSPSSTRRRVASESVGISGCFSAHRTIDARKAGSALSEQLLKPQKLVFRFQFHSVRQQGKLLDICTSIGGNRRYFRSTHVRESQWQTGGGLHEALSPLFRGTGPIQGLPGRRFIFHCSSGLLERTDDAPNGLVYLRYVRLQEHGISRLGGLSD